jgi:phospho-N-acetylmuramoyl-pentapeptide-transferase
MPWSPWLVAAVSALISLGLFALYRWSAMRRMLQAFRDAGPEHHKQKGAIPTGAGIVFVLLLVIGGGIAFVYAEGGAPSSRVAAYICWAAALMGLLGWIDDYNKVRHGSAGLKARYKLPVMLAVGLGLLYLTGGYFTDWLSSTSLTGHPLPWPIFAPWWLFYPVGLFIWLGALNGANFTDGLDGLLGLTTLVVLSGAFYALLDNHDPLSLPAAIGFGVLCAYLYFNKRPAVLYIGDSGSLAIGALVAGLFLAKGWWLFLGLSVVIWVAEVLSVMLQVASFRLFKRRILLMSPLHHHFELAGLDESAIVWIFTALQAMGCAAGIAWLRLGMGWGLTGLVLVLLCLAALLARYRRRVR